MTQKTEHNVFCKYYILAPSNNFQSSYTYGNIPRLTCFASSISRALLSIVRSSAHIPDPNTVKLYASVIKIYRVYHTYYVK